MSTSRDETLKARPAGRPRIHASPAARQAAYRLRKSDQQTTQTPGVKAAEIPVTVPPVELEATARSEYCDLAELKTFADDLAARSGKPRAITPGDWKRLGDEMRRLGVASIEYLGWTVPGPSQRWQKIKKPD